MVRPGIFSLTARGGQEGGFISRRSSEVLVLLAAARRSPFAGSCWSSDWGRWWSTRRDAQNVVDLVQASMQNPCSWV